jgi:N-acetylglutamate synthase-like GNAT family acetyltransferase
MRIGACRAPACELAAGAARDALRAIIRGVTLSPPSIELLPYAAVMQSQMLALILSIQREEFGFEISAADQPDLLDVEAFYRSGAGDFWVACSEGSVVGTIALRDIGAAQGALRKMFVAATHRGREHGIAERLLAQLMTSAAERGLREVFLGTTERFIAAHRFYEKHGFRRIQAEQLPPAFPRMALDTRFYARSTG